MKNAESSITKFCSSIDFGKIILSREEKSFYGLLNNGILRVIKSLPQSVQTAAMIVLTNHLRLPLKRDMDFFSGFYPPAWSILYWLSVSFAGDAFFSEEEMQNYYTVHAAAMLLHLMDDYLIDGDMQISHVTLLLRSQLWMVMNRSIADLAKEKNSDLQTINKYIDPLLCQH